MTLCASRYPILDTVQFNSTKEKRTFAATSSARSANKSGKPTGNPSSNQAASKIGGVTQKGNGVTEYELEKTGIRETVAHRLPESVTNEQEYVRSGILCNML